MEPLKNPGFEVPKLLEFDKIPSLREFLRHGGVPGVEYLFVGPQAMPKAQQEGWSQIIGIPFFTVGGKSATIMARGKPLTGSPAQPGTSKCLVFADDELLGSVTSPPVVAVARDEPKPAKQQAPRHEPTSNELLATK